MAIRRFGQEYLTRTRDPRRIIRQAHGILSGQLQASGRSLGSEKLSEAMAAKRIYFIDDDKFVTSLYRAKLKAEGMEVETSNDGAAAMEELPAWKPDLIVLDLHMPKPNGVEVLRFIRNTPQLQDLPVIIFSSGFVQSLVEEAGDLSVQNFLTKTECTPKMLVEEIKNLLAAKPQQTEEIPRSALDRAADRQPDVPLEELPELLRQLKAETARDKRASLLLKLYKLMQDFIHRAAAADPDTPRCKLSHALLKVFENLYRFPDRIDEANIKTLSAGTAKLVELSEKADQAALEAEQRLRKVLNGFDREENQPR